MKYFNYLPDETLKNIRDDPGNCLAEMIPIGAGITHELLRQVITVDSRLHTMRIYRRPSPRAFLKAHEATDGGALFRTIEFLRHGQEGGFVWERTA